MERLLRDIRRSRAILAAMDDREQSLPLDRAPARPRARSGASRTSGSSQSDIAIASERVAAIVEAAEAAAEELRIGTEQRARERIAEADRAADLRVEAAEAEARDLLAAARQEAAAVEAAARAAVQSIHEEAEAARRAADEYRERTLHEAREEAVRVRAEADAYASQTRQSAKAEAQAIISEAHDVARDVLAEGTELSDNLRQLSDSLRTNADRLLRDVKHAHASLTAGLGQAVPGVAPATLDTRSPSLEAPATGPGLHLDVPEFIPRSG